MSPRQKFDRHMLVVGAGRHRKFAKLTDSERCAHFLGILSLAAQSPRRGYLLIAEGVEVDAGDVANEAGGQVSVRVAGSAIEKLKRVGVLERDDEVGAWFVHDWWEVNPEPRPDPSNAQRQADFRARNAASNAGVTVPDDTRNGDGNSESNGAPPSPQTPHPPHEGEEEGGTRKRATRRVDQTQPPKNLIPELHATLDAILPILHGVWDIRGGIEPQPRGIGLALNRNPRADHMAVARRLEHWLTAGNGTRAQCRDIAARFGDWIADERSAMPAAGGRVVQMSERQARRDRGAQALDALMNDQGLSA